MRTLIVNEIEYGFMIGKHNAVIRLPSEKKLVVDISQLTNRSIETIERGRKKKNRCGMITPADIKNYIVNNLIPKEEENKNES